MRIAWFDFRTGSFYVYTLPTPNAEAWIAVLNDWFGDDCFHFVFVPGVDYVAQRVPVVFEEEWRK